MNLNFLKLHKNILLWSNSWTGIGFTVKHKIDIGFKKAAPHPCSVLKLASVFFCVCGARGMKTATSSEASHSELFCGPLRHTTARHDYKASWSQTPCLHVLSISPVTRTSAQPFKRWTEASHSAWTPADAWRAVSQTLCLCSVFPFFETMWNFMLCK